MQHYIKITVIAVLFNIAVISGSALAKSADLIPIKAKIVGGEVATEGDWPWMSVLVDTLNEISTTLTVDSTQYDSQAFTGGFAGNATGNLVDCGIGELQCTEATDKICLIERGDNTFSEKVENCQAGGGIGAIIYNHQPGIISGTLGENFTGTIPAVSVTQTDGATLKENIDTSASISVVEEDAIAQSSTCGASFLGGKWVLTAAHCVEDMLPQQLKVNVGEYDLSNGAENAKPAKRIYTHPDYYLNAELNNDIALIELIDNVNNPAVTLLGLAETEQFAIDNSMATVTGWGGRQGYAPDDGPTSNFPSVLHQVDLQLITNQECKNLLAQSYTDSFEGTFTAEDIDVTGAMICAFIPGGGKSSCQGDSGGPLMINTNEGWQQLGIVSWGIGCAADGFPGVYTRAAIFKDWIEEISQGIAIEQSFDFTVEAQNKADNAMLEVVNNSELTANLTFSVDGDANFTIANDDCNVIAANEICQLQINYDAADVGNHTANIIITPDNNNIAASRAKVSAQTIALASRIKTQLSSNDNALDWYSGGNSIWKLDNSEAAIVSGNIAGNQDSIVMVTVSGEGELSFEWSVSSEENTEEPEVPFDALYLYVDGELIKFISGEISYQSESLKLAAGEHVITWVYQKDPFGSEGDDNARIRNVTFIPVGGVAPPPVPSPPPPSTATPSASSSGGGSVAWLIFVLIGTWCARRK